MKTPTSIGIIGYGDFGKLAEKILRKTSSFQIKIHTRGVAPDGEKFFSLEEICESDIIILSVPMRAFEEVLENISPLLKGGATVIDVCSVKVHPKKCMLKILPTSVHIIGTHPMFGPATYTAYGNSIEGQNIVIENIRCEKKIYEDVRKYLREKLQLNVVEKSAEEHDKEAAEFHFGAMFVAHMIQNLGIKRSEIETGSAKKMWEFAAIVSADKELLKDMYHLNPYCKEMLERLSHTNRDLKNWILET